jgi:hypothetical protein
VTFCCDAGWTFRFIHIGIGAVCLIAVLIILYLTETELTEFIVKHLKDVRKQVFELFKTRLPFILKII